MQGGGVAVYFTEDMGRISGYGVFGESVYTIEHLDLRCASMWMGLHPDVADPDNRAWRA